MTPEAEQDQALAQAAPETAPFEGAPEPRLPAWTPCTAPKAADVIRWTEEVPIKVLANTGASAVYGRHTVVAQVVERGSSHLSLYVLSQEWLSRDVPAQPLKTGKRLRRDISAVARGDCHRLDR